MGNVSYLRCVKTRCDVTPEGRRSRRGEAKGAGSGWLTGGWGLLSEQRVWAGPPLVSEGVESRVENLQVELVADWRPAQLDLLLSSL